MTTSRPLKRRSERIIRKNLLNKKETILNKLDSKSTVTVEELTDYFNLKDAVDPAFLPEGLGNSIDRGRLERVRVFQTKQKVWQFELRRLEYDKERIVSYKRRAWGSIVAAMVMTVW